MNENVAPAWPKEQHHATLPRRCDHAAHCGIVVQSFIGLLASSGHDGVYRSESGVKLLGSGHGEGLDGVGINERTTMIGREDGEGCMKAAWQRIPMGLCDRQAPLTCAG
jgi:hypothetical protein